MLATPPSYHKIPQQENSCITFVFPYIYRIPLSTDITSWPLSAINIIRYQSPPASTEYPIC